MAKYLSKDMKQAVICLAGCVGFCETLAGVESPTYIPLREDLNTCRDAAFRVMEALLDGIPQEQILSCMRQANASELMVIPKSSPMVKKEYHVITTDVLDRLLAESISDCAFCMKEGTELNRCQRRKDLMEAGIIGRAKGECPYKGV